MLSAAEVIAEGQIHYRPHLVIGDPSQREAKMEDGLSSEEYIGVAYHEGPTTPEAGKELSVVLTSHTRCTGN
jgi:hypothetical protein